MPFGNLRHDPGQRPRPNFCGDAASYAGQRKPLISVVTPCYNEEANVVPCAEAVRQVFTEQLPDCDYEHIFCDNGSKDQTVSRLRAVARQDPHVKVILNARNFGPFCSTFNGLLSTTGDAVLVLLAADLQDPPELIPQFVAGWRKGHEIVYGIRKQREEGWLLRSVRRVYYRLVSRVASIDIPPDVGEFMLVDRVVVEALRRFDDYYPYIRGMVFSCGFRSLGIPYTWRARKRGLSKNRLYHLVDQGLNGLVSFTKLPLRLCMLFGIVTAACSLSYALLSLLLNLIWFRHLAPPGIPTLIVALFFFSGLQLFFFGVLGEYIASIHFQVRKRPLVVERERINFSAAHLPVSEPRDAAPASVTSEQV